MDEKNFQQERAPMLFLFYYYIISIMRNIMILYTHAPYAMYLPYA